MKWYVIQRDVISPNFEIFDLGDVTQEEAERILEEEIAHNLTSEWLLDEGQFKALKAKINQVK